MGNKIDSIIKKHHVSLWIWVHVVFGFAVFADRGVALAVVALAILYCVYLYESNQ